MKNKAWYALSATVLLAALTTTAATKPSVLACATTQAGMPVLHFQNELNPQGWI